MKNLLKKYVLLNSSRHHLWQCNKDFAKLIPNNSLILDAGAGSGPYKKLFKHTRYESADHMQPSAPGSPVTYECDLTNIPVEADRYDYIIFNQVMEHLPEPGAVLKELHRILRPNGKILYSGPLFYEEHEQPNDFYRYTQYGIRYLFIKHSFTIESLDWLEGYFGTVAYQFNRMYRYLPWHSHQLHLGLSEIIITPFLAVTKIGCAFTSIIFNWLDKKVKYTAHGYPKNYISILSKMVQ